jgi:hypothetical protein
MTLGGDWWLAARGSVAAIASIDADVANAAFGTPRSIVLGGWPGATTGQAWASSSAFAESVREGTIAPDVRAVMYDPERWDATPPDEQRDPIGSILAFCRVSRASGYVTIVTPHPGLVEVPGVPHQMAPGEDRDEAYLRSGIMRASAVGADVCEIQAQRHQRDPARYREIVRRAADQAREAKPDVIVLSGLSTHPGYPATAQMLRAAWEGVRDVVDGHYLSLARLRRVEAAVDFLRFAMR